MVKGSGKRYLIFLLAKTVNQQIKEIFTLHFFRKPFLSPAGYKQIKVGKFQVEPLAEVKISERALE